MASTIGSGAEVDIEGSICTGDGTYVVWWCWTWPERHHGETRWVGSPMVSTEVRVTVHNRRRGSTERDVSVDFDVLSDSVPPDVEAKLRDYAIGEEQRDWEYEARDLYPIRSLRAVAL